MNGKGKGYWSNKGGTIQAYKGEDGKWAFNSVPNMASKADFNEVLPQSIKGRKPIFYKLKLTISNPCFIFVNDEFEVYVKEGVFEIDKDDLPITSLVILGRGLDYHCEGAYY